MTREEAGAILSRIARGEEELERPKHATDDIFRHGYTLQDIRPLIRTGTVENAPEWNDEHKEFRVRILGKSLGLRTTRIVLGLRPDGPNTLVSIHPVPFVKPRRMWRERKRK